MWFYEQDGAEIGPVSAEAIRNLVADGTLSSGARVRPVDSDLCMAVSEIPSDSVDARDALDGPEELTDLAELTFSFGESGFAPLNQPSESPTAPTVPVEDKSAAKSGVAASGAMALTGQKRPAAAKKKSSFRKRRRLRSTRKSAPRDGDIPHDLYAEVFENDAPARSKPNQRNTRSVNGQDGSVERATDAGTSPEDAALRSSSSSPPVPVRLSQRPPTKDTSEVRRWSLPKPRVLGMIGVAAVVVLLSAGLMTDRLTVPGFAPDVDGFIQSTVAEYRQLNARPIPADRWEALKARVSKQGEAIVTYYSRRSSFSDEDNRRRWAVAKLIELLSCDPGDPDKVESVFADYERLHGTVGH